MVAGAGAREIVARALPFPPTAALASRLAF
jgi:hypothetical protein